MSSLSLLSYKRKLEISHCVRNDTPLCVKWVWDKVRQSRTVSHTHALADTRQSEWSLSEMSLSRQRQGNLSYFFCDPISKQSQISYNYELR